MKSTINSAKKSKRGRPSVDTEAVNVRLSTDVLSDIDKIRRNHIDPPTRPEMIRRLVTEAIAARKKLGWRVENLGDALPSAIKKITGKKM